MSTEIVYNISEELRDSRRKRYGRIAFDCFNLKERDGRAFCIKGHYLGWSEDGTIDLKLILKGITPSACKSCLDFDGGE